jgi:hypothetical protein
MESLDLTLPLIGGDVAYMRIQRPISAENFDYLMQQLAVYRRGLTGCRTVPPTDDTHCPEIRDEGVTLEMRHELIRRGHTPAEIHGMTYGQACEIIGAGEHL